MLQRCSPEMDFAVDENVTSDINVVARFLAHEQIKDLQSCPPVDCIVICVSAVFHGAETLFRVLQGRPELTKTLVLCGGIGHSTQLIYDSIKENKRYHAIAPEIDGLPESRVLRAVMDQYFDVEAITSAGCEILIEDKSTNCGANASETRKLLDDHGVAAPKTCIVIQDPTMALRTVASFEMAYKDVEMPPRMLSCPTFVPRVEIRNSSSEIRFTGLDIPDGELWQLGRFLNLIMGEIPRLRDDAAGYGPKGKGYITHVDIPNPVEEAWQRLQDVLANRR